MKKIKYSKLKIFHYIDKLNSLPLDRKEIKPPIHIRIKPTNICNHNCWYCAYKVDYLQLGQDMFERDYIPKDKMMEILDDCKDMGVKAITFSGGGEPFVYRYFLETIRSIIDKGIAFASLTNGSRLKEELAELFAYYGRWIRVSIDAWDDESYSKVRRIKVGEFSEIIENIKNFVDLKNRKCSIGISYIVDKNNYHKIYEFAKKIKDIGVDSIKISPCIVSNDGANNNLYHKPFYEKAKELSMKVKTELEDDNFEVFESYHLLEEKFDKDYSWCPYVQILPVIGADLNVYPCQDKAYNLDNGVLGSIKDISFKEWWFSDKNNFFKINPKLHCNNHCVANEKNKMILEYLNVGDLEFV